jgi:hypothetical protein
VSLEAKRKLFVGFFAVVMTIGVLASAADAPISGRRHVALLVAVAALAYLGDRGARRSGFVLTRAWWQSAPMSGRVAFGAAVVVAFALTAAEGAVAALWFGFVGGYLGGALWRAPLRG